MRRFFWMVPLLCSLAFGQGGVIGPNGVVGPNGKITPGVASASPSVVLQSQADSSFAATLNLSTASGISSGQGAVIVCAAPGASTSTITFTDTAGNTGYQLDLTFTGTGYADITRYYSNHISSSIAAAGHVTAAFSNGLSESWNCSLLSTATLAASTWFDQSATNNNSFAASQNPGTTSATTNATDYCIPAFLGQASGWGAVTWNNGYASLSQGTILTGGRSFMYGWKALAATGTQTMTVTLTSADNTNATIACYKQ